jgi:hypothetical protein
MNLRFRPLLEIIVVLGFALCASSGSAATLWNESVSGDLSDAQAAPKAFVLSLGVNSIIGSVGGTNHQDWVALTVPAGDKLTSIVLAAYSSSDAQGFTGVQAGSSFVGNAGTASPYLGYAHFGTGAQNGALPATNLVGTDILPLMGNTTLAAGSQGFTPPLAAGVYTFLIQQTGLVSGTYQFDYTVAQAPEPATVWLLGLGVLGLAPLARLRKRRRV